MLEPVRSFNAGDVVLSIARGDEIEIDNTLELRGIGGTKAKLSMDDFAGLPRHTAKTIGHGAPITFQGVLLADALSKVAVFPWAELDPRFTDRAVYLVTKRDGKPLPDGDGPFGLVLPGEKSAARWVWHVVESRSGERTEPLTITQLLLDHDLRGLDYHGDSVAGLEIQLFGATPGDDTFDFVLANLNHDVRHHVAEFDVFDHTTKLVACG